MKKISRVLLLLLLLACVADTGFSQVKKEKKTSKKKEQVEMPPPPMEELKIAVIDTAGTDKKKNGTAVEEEDLVINNFDTIPPPNDELTTELKILLTSTGAIDLGVQFAKSMRQNFQAGDLPEEFFTRIYKEMSEGEGRKIFENTLIKIYRKHYTLEDVKNINQFYNTATGKKLLASLPDIMKESQELGSGFGRMIAMKIYEDLVKEGIIK